MLPLSLVELLHAQLTIANTFWAKDRAAEAPGVAMPFAMDRKYPRAGLSWAWHWVFPQATLLTDPRSQLCGDTICMIALFNMRLSSPKNKPASINLPRLILYVIRLQPIYCIWLRYSYRTRFARACRCQYHDDLHPCFKSGRRWCP